MKEKLDLEQLARAGKFTVTSVEHDEERSSRIHRENLAHYLALAKEAAAATLGAVVALTALWVCFKTMLNPGASPQHVEWARTLSTMLVSGAVSFLVGRSTSK
jgi:hypothetical protein